MKDKLNKIRKLYEESVEVENNLLLVYENTPNSLSILKDTALTNLHLATKRVDTLKEVLIILEND